MTNKKKLSSLSQKLKAYSATAGVLLAAGQVADAQVVYTDVVDQTNKDSLYIDFNNDATIDLVLYAGTAGGVGASSVVGAGPGMIKGASRTYQINTSSYGMFWAADVLSSGANITSYYNFWGTAGQEKLVFESNGSWQGQTRKFIGVQFDISGQTHFGWVRLSISNNPEPKLTLYDFAFESTPDAGIMAGDHPPCTNFPDLPSVTGAESNTCLGSQAVLVAAGNLNDATNWEWYEGSCGTTPIGSGDTLWYAPGSLTNIFVRGYGDCITPGSCTMVTVSPDTTKPSVTCPGQTVLNGDQYGRALMPDLTVFTSVLDDCDPSPGASQSIIPGTSLEMGVTTVTMTGIDNLGNSDFCEAKILINPPPPGNALNFDGTSDFVELPQIYTTSNTEATIEAWLSPSSFSTQAVLISSDENGSFRITMNPDSTLTASIVLTGSTTHSVNNPNIKLKPFQWRHAAATWQMGDSLKLYLDGRMIAGVPVPTDLLYDAGPGTFGGIGGVASLPTNMFTGKIDEVRFWTTARTESEISGAMGDTVASNASGIFVYYRFDQTGTETTLYDYSPNQFHRAMNSLDFNSDGIASYALVRPPKPDTSLVHSGDFTLIWSNPTLGDTPSQFHLDMGTDPTFNSLVVNNSPIGTSGSSYFSGLDDGGIYYFRISSFIDAVSGKSQYSETGMVHLQSSMSLSLSKTDPTCYGGDDGTATVSISGGSAPFSYLWSNGGGSATTFVLPAGTASVTVTDKYGNEAFGNIILVDPAQITNDLAAVEICNGDSALIFGNYETLDGIYRDTLTAANGCDSIVSQMLTVYDPAIVNAGPDMATCWNEGISISGSMAGSASTITWSSSGSGSLSSTTALSTDYIPTVTDAGVGTVILTITSDDPTGPCPMVSDNMIITVLNTDFTSETLAICNGDSLFAEGAWQTTTGTFYDTLSNAGGCDSVVETQLTVFTGGYSTVPLMICPGDSVFAQGAWQTAPGNYYDTLTTWLCDSVVETIISLYSVPAFSLGNDTTLTEGDTLVLSAGSWSSTLWSTGSVTDTVWIHSSGTYFADVTNGYGCAATDTIVVTFEPQTQCEASFTYTVTGNTADFTNTSQGTISTTFWDFGDGQFVNDPTTTFAHSFPGVGYYNVCLTIVDTLGSCFDDTCITVAISPLPVNCNASFTYTSGGGAAVLFNSGVSAGQLTNYFWDFGDGAVSYASSPTHTYPAEGYYTVELTVEDTVNDCISSKTKVVMAGDILNDCEADFTYHSMLDHKKVRFTNLSSGSNLDTYLWNFGDGSFANTANAEHTFQTSAFYNVCLSVLSTSTGCANITCKTIKVGNDDHSCHATFVYVVDSTDSKAAGKSVDFKGTAFGDPAKTVWSILWNFGDGETDTTTLTPSHIYADTGLYQVTLKISSSYCTDLYFDLVNAGDWLDQIRGGFVYEIDTTSKSNQYPVDFKGAAFGDPAVISWEFGDGGMDSTTLSPNYVYAQPGDYNVCFTVADPNTGQSDTYCDSLHIDEITYINTFGRAGIAAEVYPNPAKSRAIIGYYLPESSDVTVSIADTYGRTVQVLADNAHTAGNHTIIWNVETLKSGIYMVIIRSGSEVVTQRVVISR